MPDVREIPVGDEQEPAGSDPTNEQRRAAAQAALEAHYVIKNHMSAPMNLYDEDFVDLLADLMHLADSLEIDFAACVQMAETNHEEEREGD